MRPLSSHLARAVALMARLARLSRPMSDQISAQKSPLIFARRSPLNFVPSTSLVGSLNRVPLLGLHWGLLLVLPVALLLVLLGTNEARATHGELTGFRLSSCGDSSCLTIQAQHAFAGRIPFTFAFDAAVITIEDRQTNKRLQFKSHDAYLDSISDKLFMRQVSGLDSKNVEAMYDLESGELKLFTIRTRP